MSTKRKTASKGPSSADLRNRFKDVNSIMSSMAQKRKELNASTDKPGTDVKAIIVSRYAPKKTRGAGKEYTEFRASVLAAEPLGKDEVDASTGDLTLHGVFKPGGKNDKNPQHHSIVLKYGSVQKIKVWRGMPDLAVGDLVEIKGLRPSYYISGQTDQLTCSLNCNRINVIENGRFGLVSRILDEADLGIKEIHRPELIDDEALEYLSAKRQDPDTEPKAGIFKYGEVMVLPMRELTTREKTKIVSKPKGVILNTQYDQGEPDNWKFETAQGGKPPEICMRNASIYCASWDGTWDDREESFITVSCWADQLRVFGLRKEDVPVWGLVIKLYVPLTEITAVGQVNLDSTSRNALNRFRILHEGDDPMVPFAFMHAFQANLLAFDAGKAYLSYGIEVGAKWVADYYKKSIVAGDLKTRKDAMTDKPSADVILLDNYIGNFAELCKTTAHFVVLTSFVPQSRSVVPKFAAFMKKMGQPAREALLSTMINLTKDDIRGLAESDKRIKEFLDLTESPDKFFRLTVFAVQGASTKEGREAQRRKHEELLGEFLGDAATEDQGASRSGKRAKAAPRADVHA